MLDHFKKPRTGEGKRTYRSIVLDVAALGLVLALPAHPAAAQAVSLTPFDVFLRQVQSAPSSQYLNQPESAVTDPAPFEDMRQHILNLYSGVHVKQSYLVEGHTYDCVPILEQPSVRQQHLKSIATPPAVGLPYSGPAGSSGSAGSPMQATQLNPAQPTDSLGNLMACDDGSIPMRRVTLEDITRFKTLKEFFQKGPHGAGQYRDPATNVSQDALSDHRWAHSFQAVANLGGSADFGLWDITVNQNLREVFTLSQHWYVNTQSPVQTLETGLQNFPKQYHTTKTVLFIYWTADDYQTTGCYNLSCAAFVQTNRSVHLGSGFSAYSTIGGRQVAVTLGAYLSGGNWWIYMNGTAIGYYPGSIYRGGAMANGANKIDYGGEVDSTAVWPPMGSGEFAAKGYGYASYVRSIYYYSTSNQSHSANLTAQQLWPRCFTDVTHDNSSVSGWNSYFFFGGPGGRGC